MTERILVFKGDKVVYNSLEREILCMSEDDCFRITDVPPTTILGLGVKVCIWTKNMIEVEGTELWKLGDIWIIENWEPID
ncbi:MAG: hypothetical protein J7J44_07620 [Deltaproteobacteria bacterium]|nr:hypothetical protein [Deltaproteobacteria bacterium]